MVIQSDDPTAGEAEVWKLLALVPDPEMPTVSVVDLGIVRNVAVDRRRVTVTITPTYSGCPAMHDIAADVRARLSERFDQVDVLTVLNPPWTTDWIRPLGRRKLAGAGIAPPGARLLGITAVRTSHPDACPHCGSAEVEEISAFGSSACRALWRCTQCREPFDYVKAH